MKSLGSRAEGARLERIVASPRWAGNGFRNLHPIPPGLRDPLAKMPSLKEFMFGGDARRLPPQPLPALDPRPAWQRPAQALRATWLGHSTLLLEADGVRVLTDPVWGQRASPSRIAGPKRFQPVPVAIRQLPPLDAVLISHDHYDHLCMRSVLELARRPGLPFVTSLGVGAHLAGWGVPEERIVELDWWQRWQHPSCELSVTAAPAQHFSGRGLKDRNATLWSSLVIETPRHRAFFSGDTGLTTEYREIARRFGRFDLVMLEVGAWHPAWGDIHLGPWNAIEAAGYLGAAAFLPVHWGTFSLAMHAWDEPAELLLAAHAAGRLAPGTRLVLPRLGEAFEPEREQALQPWWRALAAAPAEPAAPAPARVRKLCWPLD